MRLFVYGTLKRGHVNHKYIKSSQFIGEDFAPGLIYDGWAPVVISPKVNERGLWVKGEVYEIDERIARICDQLEGHPIMYTRTLIKLKSGKNAFIYYWNHKPRGDLIPNGEWPVKEEIHD